MKVCSIPGCGKPHRSRGWCMAHWNRWKRNGDPLAGRPSNGEAHRFLQDVVLTHRGEDCLEWPFACTEGRAVLRVNGKLEYVSRLVCESVHGPAPTPHHQAAHSCGRGFAGCVSPHHLDWKTQSENEADKLIHGTDNRGEKHYAAKISAEDVNQIRGLKGELSNKDIASRFGISDALVRDIHSGRVWGWLPPAMTAGGDA